jgi:hypothetical protein
LQDGAGKGGFAAAGFADNAQRFPGLQVEGNIGQRL